MKPVGVFAYGSLKAGEAGAGVAEAAGLVARVPAVAEGLSLFALPAGYPAAVLGEGRVFGELLLFADLDRALSALDAYEDAGREYVRRTIWVETEEGRRPAWVYLYPSLEAVRRAGGTPLQEGRWRGALPEEP